MEEEIIECDDSKAIKTTKHPTLKEVQKKMQGFPESLVYYTYHKLNGREEEAQSYLNEWNEEQEELANLFSKRNELNEVNNNPLCQDIASNILPNPNYRISEEGNETKEIDL